MHHKHQTKSIMVLFWCDNWNNSSMG